MRIKQIFASVGNLILPSHAFAALNAPEFRVGLFVSAEKSIKGRIESYLSGELRALRDVVPSKTNYEFDMTVVAVKAYSKDGYETGVVLSITIHQKFNNQLFAHMFKEQDKESGIEWTDGLYFYPEHWVRIGSDEDLQSICRGIIADFDCQILQKEREAYQKMIDTFNKNKGSANN